MKVLFKKIDSDHNGGIDLEEWKHFLALLILEDAEYIRRLGLTNRRTYWGKGRGEPQADLCLQTSDTNPVYGFIDRGWLTDLWYHQRNNHPILGLFLADKDHYLIIPQRLNIELCVYSWSFLSSILIYNSYWRDTIWQRILLEMVFVSVPMIIIRDCLYLCFTCPCLQARNNVETCVQKVYLPMLWGSGHFIGGVSLCCSVIFIVIGIYYVKSGFFTGFIVSIILSYLLCFLEDLLIKFNVHLVWFYDNGGFPLRFLGVGEWEGSRQMVLRALEAEKLSTHGVVHGMPSPKFTSSPLTSPKFTPAVELTSIDEEAAVP